MEEPKRFYHAKILEGTLLLPWSTRHVHGHRCEVQEKIKLITDETCSHGVVDSPAFARNGNIELIATRVKGSAPVCHAQTCQLAPIGPKDGPGIQKGASCP